MFGVVDLEQALVFGSSGLNWNECRDEASEIYIADFLKGKGEWDSPLREFEVPDYTFEIVLDYGAWRQLHRHRMLTMISQPLTTKLGYRVPALIREAGLDSRFNSAMHLADVCYDSLRKINPALASYLVTHAHHRRCMVKVNLRELHHLKRLRTSIRAHESIRWVVQDMVNQVWRVHKQLIQPEEQE